MPLVGTELPRRFCRWVHADWSQERMADGKTMKNMRCDVMRYSCSCRWEMQVACMGCIRPVQLKPQVGPQHSTVTEHAGEEAVGGEIAWSGLTERLAWAWGNEGTT